MTSLDQLSSIRDVTGSVIINTWRHRISYHQYMTSLNQLSSIRDVTKSVIINTWRHWISYHQYMKSLDQLSSIRDNLVTFRIRTNHYYKDVNYVIYMYISQTPLKFYKVSEFLENLMPIARANINLHTLFCVF